MSGPQWISLAFVLGVMFGVLMLYFVTRPAPRTIDEMIRSTTHRPPPPPPKEEIPQWLRKNVDGTYRVPMGKRIEVLPSNVDRLILSYPEFLSKEQRVQMQHLLKDAWEDDTRKVIVLEGGIKIEAVTLMQGEIYKDEDMDILRSCVEPTKPWREPPPPPEPPPTRDVYPM